MSVDQATSEAFPVGLVPTIVLDLNVQVETAFTTVHLLAFLVRANEATVDFFRRPSHMLLTQLLLPCGFKRPKALSRDRSRIGTLVGRLLCRMLARFLLTGGSCRGLHVRHGFLFEFKGFHLAIDLLLFLLDHLGMVQVLLRETHKLGNEMVLVVVLDVVYFTACVEVLTGRFLQLLEQLLVVEVGSPKEFIVVDFGIEVKIFSSERVLNLHVGALVTLLVSLGGEGGDPFLELITAHVLEDVVGQLRRHFVGLEQLKVDVEGWLHAQRRF